MAKLVEKRQETGDNLQKVREAEEEVREVRDVYPPVPFPLILCKFIFLL